MSPKYDFSLIHIKPATGLHQALFSCGGPLQIAPSLTFVNVGLAIAWHIPTYKTAKIIQVQRLNRRIQMDTQTVAAKDKLITDFKTVMTDTEELLHATANQAGEKVTAARGRVEERLRLARDELDRAQAAVVNKTRAAARATDGYVHEHPWSIAGICAGVGLLLGMLISRR